MLFRSDLPRGTEIVFHGDPTTLKIGVSDFAKKRHVEGSGYSYFRGDWEELICLVRVSLINAVAGQGEKDLTRKIVVPINQRMELFVGTTVKLRKGMVLDAEVAQRQEDEDLYAKVFALADPDPVVKVEIVLYSRAALTENVNESSGDWEIVAILAKTNEYEPMSPLAMARNMLEKPGGTKSIYNAEELSQSIYFWSQRVSVKA